MSRFVQQSACAGKRPSGVAPDRLRSRPRLLSRLLSDRTAPRLIAAPPGFGKATLAFEYASVMFQFEHVFWVRGSSPCFLRDLDAAALAEAILAADDEAALAVFVDLPALDEARSRAFAKEAERLLGKGCEVVATMSRFDVAEKLFERSVTVRPEEMMVTGEEMEDDAGEALGERAVGLAERIPALRWGSATPGQVMHEASQMGLSPDEELALWAMTVLARGSLADLAALFGARRAETLWRVLGVCCPHFGILADEGRFTALSVPLEEVRALARQRIQPLAEACGLAGREKVVEILADCLMERGECRRAARAVALLAHRQAHGQWLAKRGWEALWSGAAVEVCALCDSATRAQVDNRVDMNALAAWAWAQREDRARAVSFARRSLASPQRTPKTILAAALSAWDVGNAVTRRAMEGEIIACLGTLASADDVAQKPGMAELVGVAEVAMAPERGEDCLEVWAACFSGIEGWGAGSRVDLERRLLGVAAVLEGMEESGAFANGADVAVAGRPELVRLAACSHRALEALASRGSGLGFGAFRAAAALDREAAVLDGLGIPRLPDIVAAALGAAHVERGRARALQKSRVRDGAAASFDFPVSSEAVCGNAPMVVLQETVEPLRVRLFGPMRVAIGRTDITGQFENRPKTRLLLALLVLHRRRELGRDQLVSMLWPAADLRTGAKSFYRIWGDLRSVLSRGGECPYLVRSRYGCRLDSSLVESDLDEFEALVRCLLFGPQDDLAWEQAVLTVKGSFGSVLLPSERSNSVIDLFRDRFDCELLDALITASRRLMDQGDFQGSLWLAREAFQRDAGREDACAALMRAQVSTGQRGAAVQTFFRCRDHLARTLGLDPSPALEALYRQLLDGALSEI